jgi:acyl-CoA thioester hydrolase
MKKYTKEINVTGTYIDFNDHVNNIEFIKWAQFVSEEHWNLLATPQMINDYIWVVSRNEIDYFKQVRLGDTIQLVTWIESTVKATSVRVIEIFNVTRNELAAKARIIWYALDPQTKRPKRIAEDAKQLFEE